jgi:tetratricopeptide (TPR) repeat protein
MAAVNGPNSAPAASAPAAPKSEPKLPEGPPAPAPNALLAAAIADIPDNAPELAEEVDVPIEIRRRIIGLHSVVTSLDHYALLAIPRDADKKAVKRSYFELAAVFHPDRYFRKNLGSFKGKMEIIFGNVSTAYETLTDKEKRAEYDIYLGDVEKSRNVESMLRNVMAEVHQAEQSILDAAGDAPVQSQSGPSQSGPMSTRSGAYASVDPRAASTSVTPAASTPVPTPPRTTVSDQLRREALAMRLKGFARPAAKASVAPSAIVNPSIPPLRGSSVDGVEALKRRYEEKVDGARRAQGDKYVKLAETAESRNDLTAAAASYRVALTFLREDEPAYAHAKEVIAKSEQVLGETYIRQAEHEEKATRWEDAVRSWGRAVKLRPTDHRAHERYAHALVQSNGDLHEASQIAQKAVAMAPGASEYRCTLAAVYAAAGLLLNARRELEAAALQFPESPAITAMLKRLTKTA